MRALLLLPLALTGCSGDPIPAGAGALAMGVAFAALLVADLAHKLYRRL